MSDRPNFACRLTLPMAWEALDRVPTEGEREAAQWSNAGIVRFLLHETDVKAALRPAEERLAEALVPIHTKLDMIVEVLGRLAYRELALPPPRDVELSLDRITWHSAEPLKIGGWVRLKLFFHPTFLEPVVLFAQVSHCGEAGGSVQADMGEMPEATGESFARLAFLAQRRQRAERAPSTPARQIA